MTTTVQEFDAVDNFAGPGGWDVAAIELGLHVLGIEWDDTAVLTRKAAGHPTVQGDVSELDPRQYPSRGQIGSPPCQGFSLAGKGRGRADSVALLERLASVETLDDLLAAMDEMREVMSDEKTLLALEPLRWALTNRPDWIAWEQVPPVLPLWLACARILRLHGYSVETAVLSAEMFGVPQTRKRAILVARSAAMSAAIGPVALPVPTHSKFYARNPTKLDEGVEKWVSMAEALGWGRRQDADVTVCTGQNSRINAAGDTRLFSRDVNAPAPTVTGQARSWRIEGLPPQTLVGDPDVDKWVFCGAGAAAERTAGQVPRSLNEPAHTITGKGTAAWKPRVPAPAIGGETAADLDWVYDRPSPTIVGSFAPDVVAKPGYRKAGDPPRQKTPGSVRITTAEAARLQSFPDAYPWQGKSGKVFLQIGNAIPPLLAWHTLRAAIGIGRVAA